MGCKGKSKYKYDDVKRTLEDKGYDVLSTELYDSNSKIDYICRKHKDKGIQHISVYHAMSGKCKKEYAISMGYNYLEIPYWAIKKDEYKNIIDNKINGILYEK